MLSGIIIRNKQSSGTHLPRTSCYVKMLTKAVVRNETEASGKVFTMRKMWMGSYTSLRGTKEDLSKGVVPRKVLTRTGTTRRMILATTSTTGLIHSHSISVDSVENVLKFNNFTIVDVRPQKGRSKSLIYRRTNGGERCLTRTPVRTRHSLRPIRFPQQPRDHTYGH